jgi:hypothetical protein
VGVELRLLARRAEHEGAARRQQRVFAKAGRRAAEEVEAGAGQGAHLRRAVALHEQGRRTPAAVVTRLRLAFQHDDTRALGQPVGDRRPADACADDDEICGFMTHATSRFSEKEKSSISERYARGGAGASLISTRWAFQAARGGVGNDAGGQGWPRAAGVDFKIRKG